MIFKILKSGSIIILIFFAYFVSSLVADL